MQKLCVFSLKEVLVESRPRMYLNVLAFGYMHIVSKNFRRTVFG